MDEQGQVTQVAYDAYEEVLVNTLPTDLADTLGIISDPATGLTYLGNGRYYDPLLGWPLQPTPSGGAPTVPQSLNRYAATPLGQPGVAEAVANDIGLRIATSFASNLSAEVRQQIVKNKAWQGFSRLKPEEFRRVIRTLAFHESIPAATYLSRRIGGVGFRGAGLTIGKLVPGVGADFIVGFLTWLNLGWWEDRSCSRLVNVPKPSDLFITPLALVTTIVIDVHAGESIGNTLIYLTGSSLDIPRNLKPLN